MSTINLGPGPVLIPLNLWATAHLTDLYTAKTEADFNTAFDAFFAQTVTVFFNGKTTTRAEYKNIISQEVLSQATATINVPEEVDTPISSKPISENANVVGLFFTATITGVAKGDLAPIQSVSSSLNLV